eukprot:TRINITY_DN4320_c0_g1_i3.p2 TRINITY_DN4320_c0_g1~~TRINITY_DN4320_c0_g1_i3.p2  ORF type:complete len:317 (+),score=137.98 TRINITY_DN4320_c0_g1_i3:62-1012(+)
MKVLAPLMLLQLAGSAAAVCEDMQVDGKPWGESIGMSCDWHVGRQCAQADMPFGGKGYPTGREACCACKCENDPYMFGCPLFGTPKTAVPTPVPTTAVPETEAPVVCKNKDDHYCSYESFCKYGDYAADCPVLCDACPEPTPAPLCADVEGAEYCQRYSHFCKYDDFKVSCPATCGACPEPEPVWWPAFDSRACRPGTPARAAELGKTAFATRKECCVAHRAGRLGDFNFCMTRDWDVVAGAPTAAPTPAPTVAADEPVWWAAFASRSCRPGTPARAGELKKTTFVTREECCKANKGRMPNFSKCMSRVWATVAGQ